MSTISNSQQKEPVIPIELPSRLWKVLGMDIFVQGNKYYLLVVHYFNNFPYVQKMSGIFSKEVISALIFCFSVLALQKKSSVAIVPSLPAKSTRNSLTSGDLPLLQAVLTTQEVMASLRGKSRSSRSFSTDVMRIVPSTKWLFRSWGQFPWQ